MERSKKKVELPLILGVIFFKNDDNNIQALYQFSKLFKIILGVTHDEFRKLNIKKNQTSAVYDVKNVLDIVNA